MAFLCYNCRMARTRVSTTVDEKLLQDARDALSTTTDAALLDMALAALLDRRRAAAIDMAYAAYDEQPIDHPDAWGDLASFRQAASAS
jgi:Arc/MetJ family transcription regulator